MANDSHADKQQSMEANPPPGEPSEDALERIADAHWNGGGDGVKFSDIYQHNACNHTLSGTIDIDGKAFGFIIESGDRNGTVVHAWGEPEDVGVYDPGPPPEPRTFVPRDPLLHLTSPAMFGVYAQWRKQPWFAEKERAYNYDRYFQPGGKIEGFYCGWAASKGMVVGFLSALPPDARAILAVRKEPDSHE